MPYGNSGSVPSDLLGLQSFGSLHVYPSGDDLARRPWDEMQREFDTVAYNSAPGQPLVIDETGTAEQHWCGAEAVHGHRPAPGGRLGGAVRRTGRLHPRPHRRRAAPPRHVPGVRLAHVPVRLRAQSTPPVTKLPSTRVVLPTADSTVHGTAATLWASAHGGDGPCHPGGVLHHRRRADRCPRLHRRPRRSSGGAAAGTRTTVPDGTYSVASTVTNSFDLQARSEPITFVVDNTLPEAVARSLRRPPVSGSLAPTSPCGRRVMCSTWPGSSSACRAPVSTTR